MVEFLLLFVQVRVSCFSFFQVGGALALVLHPESTSAAAPTMSFLFIESLWLAPTLSATLFSSLAE